LIDCLTESGFVNTVYNTVIYEILAHL